MESTQLDRIEKKLDRLITLNTKIAKALHLIPVTEKEEREFQLRKRENTEIVAKVTHQLMEMSPKADDTTAVLPGLQDIDIAQFADVLGDDFLRKE